MKHLTFFVLLIIILLASCNHNDTPDESIEYWNCEQLIDTTGLNLYPFEPLTKLITGDTYKKIVEQRQIPEDFLHEMTTKALFYQFLYCELTRFIFTWFSPNILNIQGSFEEAKKQLNMVSELLNRPDAGHVLLGILQKVDPLYLSDKYSSLGYDDDWYCTDVNDYMQIILAQLKIISRMTEKEIDLYIREQLRCHDVIQHLCETNTPYHRYPGSVTRILFGLGNVMIRYEFEPFMQLLETNAHCRSLMKMAMISNDKQTALLIMDCVIKFKNRKK